MTILKQGLKGKVSGFHSEVKKLERPYITITEETYKSLVDGSYDYYLTDTGKVVTFGNADGGFALMPLNDKESEKILELNGLAKKKFNQMEIIGVRWDDDGESGLSSTVTIDGPDFVISDNDELDEWITEELSNKYGYTHFGWDDLRFL